MKSLLKWARKVIGDSRGSIAIKFALAVPVIALLSSASIDLMAVGSAKSRLQSIADNAALAGARSLTLAADKILAEQRAESFVEGEFSNWSGAPTYTGTYVVTEARDGRSLKVTLTGHRPSFFGSILPPGGWHFAAIATASPVGQTPLCAIGTGGGNLNSISLVSAARITAPECMVHSNANIVVRNTAQISAAAVQTVKAATATGISPAAGRGAIPIEDPFASMVFPRGTGCGDDDDEKPIVYDNNATHFLDPGTHCRPIEVRLNTRLVLRPGVHVFKQDLTLWGSTRLSGEDVFLFFDRESDTNFVGPWITVALAGRKTGPYAGMVMATTSGEDPDIEIPGSRVEQLLGVVYVRNGVLTVYGAGAAASASDWTVVVAKQIDLIGRATLKINADYENSDVPVPAGVGPNGAIMTGTRLSD